MANGTTQDPVLLLGPRQYNRFLGNPPAGSTPDEAFGNEMGYPWTVELDASSLLDKVNNLEAENTQLQDTVDVLTGTGS